MSSHNRHHGFFDGFWSTGIWVGLRIYLLPCLLLAGIYMSGATAEGSSAGGKLGGHLSKFQVMDQFDASMSAFNGVMGQAKANVLGFGGGAVRGSAGAKFIRP